MYMLGIIVTSAFLMGHFVQHKNSGKCNNFSHKIFLNNLVISILSPFFVIQHFTILYLIQKMLASTVVCLCRFSRKSRLDCTYYK